MEKTADPSAFAQNQGIETSASIDGEDDIPACQSCRKRKLKCSRETPSCTQCSRLGCVCTYDRKKLKPGIKSGAVESLNRRLEVLEKLLLDSEGNQKPQLAPADVQGCVYHASLLLANELRKENALSSTLTASPNRVSNDANRLNCHESSNFVFGVPDRDETGNSLSSRKRRRTDSGRESPSRDVENSDDDESLSDLPSPKILDILVDTFCTIIHPWIPFLHLSRFKAEVTDLQSRPELRIIFHAIVVATMKHVSEDEVGMSRIEMRRQVRFSKKVVLLNAMNSLTIENIQALIILAFDNIGGGQVSKAWSIIGSLTRTVEYLQLTIEPDKILHHSLSTPLLLLDKEADWTTCEDQRRIFWNVFLLDRFCSVTTGWNTSLTSDDVHRRLPCDGGLWRREEPVGTPYFGIWDKNAARIGNSIAHIPAHYPTSDHDTDHRSPGASSSSGIVDTSKLGAFAYCIEATESLSQVTTFFLQQKVDFRSRQEVGSWLTRFKELDLRLVHWKMFLPPKWKDSNISHDATLINMDPNLTLAHITHNTSMILLHQHIAYPPLDWRELVKLPSVCSAETCQLAAVETAYISQKYLKYTPIGIVNSQFTFCVFVAARALLVHWRFYDAELLPEFFNLVDSLHSMSIRWRGYDADDLSFQKLDLAGQYALELRSLHQRCMESASFSIHANFGDLLPSLAIPRSSNSSKSTSIPSWNQVMPVQAGITREMNAKHQHHNSIRQSQDPRLSVAHNGHMPRQYPINGTMSSYAGSPPNIPASPFANSPYSTHPQHQFQRQEEQANTLHPVPSPNSVNHNSPVNAKRNGGTSNHANVAGDMQSISYGSEHNSVEDELTAMSHVLLGQQFLEMDRVITFHETNFALDYGAWEGFS